MSRTGWPRSRASICIRTVRWPNGSPGSASGPLHTGLAAGFAEFYGIGNPENTFDVSALASGRYWLEAEVNPDGTYQEADTSNNIARVQVSI
ncbi:MAG TPA: hypothetical protein VHW23_38010 [Kofleriaceae bacterium]|jgi:hypothetical protein|nr:hypothetical protein [Kofleriaceae bacterium]